MIRHPSQPPSSPSERRSPRSGPLALAACALAVAVLAGAAQGERSKAEVATAGSEPAAGAPGATAPQKREKMVDVVAVSAKLIAELGPKLPPPGRARLARGIEQVGRLWHPEDGDLGAFVREQFVAAPAKLDGTFSRLEGILEQLDGNFAEMRRALREPTDLDSGPLLPTDPLLAAYEPSAHLVQDLFDAKVGFVALLNFPLSTLAERLDAGKAWTRRQWAEARLTERFGRRVPAQVAQAQAAAAAAAELYIAQYNVWMHHLVGEHGERPFPKGLRLISHWNLRDELKADYADRGAGLEKQRMILKVMDRVVTQTIPEAVIDNPHLDWNPYTNAVTAAPAPEVEENAPARPAVPRTDPEPSVRYARLLENFRAAREADSYSPVAPTAIARSFELERQIPEARVVALLQAVLESPEVPRVAGVIQANLGRKLEPQDLWYSGFQPRGRVEEKVLDEKVRQRYPTRKAFAEDVPRVLRDLGFSREKAGFLASHIVVDASRGAGHALPAARRGDFPHLRTRVEADGMNYKGYNIAVHELGHNVEQVFSLYEIDHTLLAGVPNNAFTEALAFVFQARDLELLGLAEPDAASERQRVLNDFWQTWEIAGVGLVDIAVWHWMYDHPDATPAALRDAVVALARQTWNRYYEPVLGGHDSVLLGIYSHMISYPLYLADYPLGHMIAFQIEQQIHKAGKLGPEFERMAKLGNIAPDLWMEAAAGAPVSAEPLLAATAAALGGAR